MGQKVYSKFTKERRPQFQIETSIYSHAEKKYVEKRALLPCGNVHINQMFERYEMFHRQGLDILVESEMKSDGTICFEFVDGICYAEKLIGIVKTGSYSAFIAELEAYLRIVESLSFEKTKFVSTAEFEEVFGCEAGVAEQPALTYANIDLTFDNMIWVNEQNLKVIDYEWIFSFPVPRDFIVYRALISFYMKFHKELEGFITIDETYEKLGIAPNAVAAYERMNRCFNEYIYGGQEGYLAILSKYKKASFHLQQSYFNESDHAQVFWDDGQGYREENSKFFPVKADGRTEQLRISLPEAMNIGRLRFDPTTYPSLIELRTIEAIRTDGSKIDITVIEENAAARKGRIFMFSEPDPQMSFLLDNTEEICEVCISYRILEVFGPNQDEHISYAQERLLEMVNENAKYRSEYERLQKLGFVKLYNRMKKLKAKMGGRR